MKPLSGVRVLDMTRLLPGPYCTMILADFGAEVIKVEPPGEGDYARWYPPLRAGMGYRHIILNRNKKSITLNLKSEEGRNIFYKLAENADVIVESFRPGVTTRLGVGYEKIKEINPRIVYCSITGFGQTGPYKMEAGHDINYISLAGITSMTGERKGMPHIPGVQIADIAVGGVMSATGILLALCGREKSGKGQYVDMSMHDGAVAMLPSPASFYFGGGWVPRRGESRLSGGLPQYNIYETRDGRHLSVGALEKKFWANLCRVIGHPELVDDIDDEQKHENLFKVLKSAFAEKTLDEWVEAFDGQDACVTPVKELDEVFVDPQVVERGMVVNLEDEKLGKYKQLGIPIKLSETPGSLDKRAPSLGEHNEEILAEIGYKGDDVLRLKQNRVI
jgi:crotonobetainyl-CoA:carnitine CoA-transferase CaiB-like acyl-CoA transferase